MRAPFPHDETERLTALRAFHVLDTAPEQSYDDLTLLASEICGTPISLISLIDDQRQWFKSVVGLGVRETHRDMAFCAHAILNPNEALIVPDAARDSRFFDNALVTGDPNIRFYAGMPLVSFDGAAVGTLCVIDRTPRELTSGQIAALRVLARQVVYQLELRRALEEQLSTVMRLRQAEADLRGEQQKQLENRDELLSHVSHELRSPLTVIYQYVTVLLDGLAGDLAPRQRELLDITLKNSLQLQRMIGDLIDTTRARTGKLTLDRRRTSIHGIASDVVDSLQVAASAKQITLNAQLGEAIPEVLGDPDRLRQVIVNLVENAIKFTPEAGTITVHVEAHSDDPEFVRVSVEDNGRGIGPDDQERVFEQLYQARGNSQQSRKGIGLGLYICRELVKRQGGELWVESELGRGSRFCFTAPVFEFATLIAPLLTSEHLDRGTLALLQVHIFPRPGSHGAQADADPIGAAWRIVRASTAPATDVVMPRLGEDDRSETLVVVAAADQSSADALVHRIERQLEADAEVTQSHEWRLVSTLLELPAACTSNQDEVASVIAAIIDPHLDEGSWRRAA